MRERLILLFITQQCTVDKFTFSFLESMLMRSGINIFNGQNEIVIYFLDETIKLFAKTLCEVTISCILYIYNFFFLKKK